MNFRKNLSVETFLVIFLVIFENVSSHSNSKSRTKRSDEYFVVSFDDDSGVGQPLYLTPLIEAGQVDFARNRAKVVHSQINIDSYAGYFTVNETFNSNLFFWYFPARKVNPDNASVLLYLGGQARGNLFFDIFTQNGPFQMKHGNILEERLESWNNEHNVIYIDAQVGSGYSFTDSDKGYPTSQEQMAVELYAALKQFFQLFASLQKNDFFMTAHGYAAKVILEVSSLIYESRSSANTTINLKGLAIAHGFVDPLHQFYYGKYLRDNGLIEEAVESWFLDQEEVARLSMTIDNHTQAYDMYERLIMGKNTYFNNLTGYTHPYNILEAGDEGNPYFSNEWIQYNEQRRALHVGSNHYTELNIKALNSLKTEVTRSQAKHLGEALNRYRVLVYTGNYDILCSPLSVKDYLERIVWLFWDDFGKAERQQWRVGSGELTGYIKKIDDPRGYLAEVIIRNAGHFSSRDQPQWSLELLEKFTQGLL